MRSYLDSNANIRRRVTALVRLLQPVTIPMISMNGHLHMQRTTQTQAYAIPVKLVNKNNWGTRQKWWGKWNHNYCRVGSMSLLNVALVCFHVWVETSHLVFHFLPWVWVILFDLSSAHCFVTMTSTHLMSNTPKSTVVPPICSREVDLCKITTSLW